MTDLATMQGRIEWARDQVLRLEREDLADALARLPEPWRYETNWDNIRRYERGRRAVPIDYLTALSELSGVSLDYLIAGRAPRGTAPDAIRRMRRALDQIEDQYRTDPLDVPLDAYERLDLEDHSGGSS